MASLTWRPDNQSHNRGEAPHGQSMVEFILVFPLFILIIIGLMEFSVAFNALLGVNFASRDATLLAAEASSDVGSDCVVLQSVESDISAPADKNRIGEVAVYWATDTGEMMPGSPVNRYRRSGSLTCTTPGGTVLTLPYSMVGAEGYPATARCDVQGGCGGGHDTVDTIAVSISYQHLWITPLARLVSLGGVGFDFEHVNAMRMEPSL